MLTVRLPFALGALLLAGCGGGGGDGGSARCTSLNTSQSHIDSTCVGCTISGPGDVADGDLYSFADVALTDFNAQASIRAGTGGAMVPAGTRAGAFYTSRVDFTPGVNGNGVQIRTYLNGAPVESSVAPSHATAGGGTDADHFFWFVTTAPYDAVEITLQYTNAQNLSTADVRVYEICSDGDV